jgi:hypothetical protein
VVLEEEDGKRLPIFNLSEALLAIRHWTQF